MKTLTALLNSNRVKAWLVGTAMAFLQKQFPDYMPDKEIVEALIYAIIAFIVGDTVRPIDPAKPTMLEPRAQTPTIQT